MAVARPDAVRARTGSPLLLSFDRREDGDCSSRVVLFDLGVNRFLAPFTITTIEIRTDRPGSFGFACGMTMIHGTVVIEGEPVEPSGPAPTRPVDDDDAGAADLDAEEAAHRAELTDLARRVLVGALLTVPVFVAVMSMEVFEATWVPDALLEPWVQPALVTPVWRGWAGPSTGPAGWRWPIGRAGMNSLCGAFASAGRPHATVAPCRRPALNRYGRNTEVPGRPSS